jgi:Cupredoxin-like domain
MQGDPVGGTVKARWTRLATLGLLLAALAPLLILGAGLVWGLDTSGDLAFFGIVAGIALVGAFFMNSGGTWGKVLGVFGAVLVVMAMFWTAFGLFAPMSFFDFVPGVLLVPGALIAIVSGIGAIVASRRGHVSTTAEGSEGRGIRLVLTVVLILALVSGALTFVSRSSVDDGAADQVVTLSDFEFDSQSYEFEGGSTVLVRNDDPFLHTFTIEELDIDVVMNPGSEELVDIPMRPGDYVVFCQPHTSDPEDPDEEDMAAEMAIQ